MNLSYNPNRNNNNPTKLKANERTVLTEINKLLDYELSVQRARNIEIAGENDRLIQEKLLLESENSKLKNEIARAKVTDKQNVIMKKWK